jgi:hypothetical protein
MGMNLGKTPQWLASNNLPASDEELIEAARYVIGYDAGFFETGNIGSSPSENYKKGYEDGCGDRLNHESK